MQDGAAVNSTHQNVNLISQHAFRAGGRGRNYRFLKGLNRSFSNQSVDGADARVLRHTSGKGQGAGGAGRARPRYFCRLDCNGRDTYGTAAGTET